MRHRVYGRHFGRDKNQRTSLFKSLVGSLFTYGTIETTEAKAKAIKGMVDKIINLAKSKNSQHLLQAFFVNKNLQQRLVTEVAPKLADRQSGYTNTLRLGVRPGDRTMMIRMSLIGNEKLEPIKSDKIRKTQMKSEDQKISKPVGQKKSAETPKHRSADIPILSDLSEKKVKPAKKVALKKVTK